MNKPSEVQEAYNTLIDCINDMANDAGGLRVTDMAAINGMTNAVINLKQDLATAKQELSDLKAELPKIKADAVLVFCEWLLSEINWDVSNYGKDYAKKLEAGE